MRFGSITTDIIADGLIFNIDAANRASYPSQRTLLTSESGSCFNTLDLSQSGSLISDPTFIQSPTPNFEFDGVDDWINCGEISPLFEYFPIGTARSNPWSASMWVKGSGSNKGFFEIPYTQVNALYARSFAFVKGASYLYFGGKYVGIKIKESGTTAYSNTEWNHIVMTFDGVDHTALSSYTLYVGGASVGIALITPNIGDFFTENISIGVAGSDGGTTYYWDGEIGPVQLYNRALPSTEVLHNYNALKGRFGLS